MFGIILIDFFSALQIEKNQRKKKWLLVSIFSNLGLLFFFKYSNFFIENINTAIGSNFILFKIILPLGLSFHTFQSLSYTIEVYRGNQKAVKHLGYFSLYVLFYPQLVAGPIERPQHLLPQFFTAHKFNWQNLHEGIRLMLWGFVKKVVLADRLSGFVDNVFNHPLNANCGATWLAVIFFAIQIYADFSGYSDIAIGCAKCMGIDLCINFKRPYFSKNIKEFWHRWHVSLSSWFRDYVYIPLGGNRKGELKKNVNTLCTFILSGLWHGAGWNFIIWGSLHGSYAVLFNLYERYISKRIFPKIIGWFLTILVVLFAWIFFRASSFHNAIEVITSALHFSNFSLRGALTNYGLNTIILIALVCGYVFGVERFSSLTLNSFNKYFVADIIFMNINCFLIIFWGVFHKISFIYFQF
ncbi:MBOAT family O-acyltransferase [Ferruginibacter albus]|uniref:MBOAT family O-acyltransferase n=1 Tax=Ferruginibacter albus TaxID=2875540 RepID=UPI001CC5752E|nr:MBOAT family O-acyltransferase [Ferruginibacter albus]